MHISQGPSQLIEQNRYRVWKQQSLTQYTTINPFPSMSVHTSRILEDPLLLCESCVLVRRRLRFPMR